MASLFAVIGRFLASNSLKKGELSAGDVLHLFPEAADAVVLADCGDIGILVFWHSFSESELVATVLNRTITGTSRSFA